MSRIKSIVIVVFSFLVLFPHSVFANTITASTLVGCHIVFFNIFIGIFEGLLISKLYKVKKGWTILVMIGANYFSACAGYFLMGWVRSLSDDITVYNVGKWVLFLWLVFFISTVLAEYPFIAFALRRTEKYLKKSLYASFLVQGISYLCLIPLYFLAGSHGLIFFTRSDPSLTFVNNPDAMVYFILEKDGSVYQMNLRDRKPELVFDAVRLTNKTDELYMEQKEGKDEWDLFAFANTHPVYNKEHGYYEKDEGDHVLIRENICSTPNRTLEENGCVVQTEYVDYRSEGQKTWGIQLFAIQGHGLLINGVHFIPVALDTPFISWVPSNVTVLPNNQIVFEMGRQICILDCETRKIGVLAKGRSPIVVLVK